MKKATKIGVAYIAGCLISGKEINSVFDYESSKHFLFSGDVKDNNVSVYDHDLNCHIVGFGAGGLFSLYHYGNKKHITLEISKEHFSGYDYDSGQHFTGTVSEGAINLFDYGTGQYSQYAI